jgi:hypothetical protein
MVLLEVRFGAETTLPVKGVNDILRHISTWQLRQRKAGKMGDTGQLQFSIRLGMPAKIKPNTFRVYLNEEDTALLAGICGKTEQGQTELLSRIAKAGLLAIAQNDNSFHLPLRFDVSAAGTSRVLVMNDSEKSRRGK